MGQYRIVVSGRVQGVGFRYFTLSKALEFDIKGWVRNREDGTVEASASGTESQLSDFIASLRRGTRFSLVENLEITPEEDRGEYAGFRIK
ncbi:acylphosphatase [Peribacillus kribbensis]|uniref:acylphosphatase n=1 Tax=Peribacillus kribbensis TaxID=356658 RepID=UPI00041D0B97|nr:acylphosphatase [Peribacillus kribbensis]